MMQELLLNTQEYNPIKKQKILIVFDDMIADVRSNRKLNPIVTEFLLEAENKYFYCFYHTILFGCSKI